MKANRILAVCGMVGALSLLAPLSEAQRVTGFEPGDPAPLTSGDAGTRTSYQGVAPTEGTQQFLLTTINGAGIDNTDGFSSQSGTNAVGAVALGTFVGTSITGTEGSAFKLSILITPGANVIRLSYDFLTNEFPPDNHLDLAFAVLLDSSNSVVGGIRTIATPASVDFNNLALQLPGGFPFLFHTGYSTFDIVVATPGTYTLAIGVIDRTTADIPSALLVDDVRIVPEPSTVALAFAGLGLLVGYQRVRGQRRL